MKNDPDIAEALRAKAAEYFGYANDNIKYATMVLLVLEEELRQGGKQA